MLTYEVNDAQRFMRTREDLRDDGASLCRPARPRRPSLPLGCCSRRLSVPPARHAAHRPLPHAPAPPVSQTMASRVIIVAFAELVAILLVAYLQVRTLKSFFEVRTRI